jgi:hypothetical protein
MKRGIIGIIVLTLLTACGRSDQAASTGNGAPDLPAKMRWLSGTPIPEPPTGTPYRPLVRTTVVELNTTIAGNSTQFGVSIPRDHGLHLVASTETWPSFEWSVEFDPQVFGVTVHDQPYTASQGFEPYPAGGWILTPLQQGTYPLTIQLRLDPCAGCAMVSRFTLYSVTID